MQLQLYLHFPFCKRKCFYCDFCSAPAPPSEIAAYGKAMEREIALAGERWRGAEVSSVFLGGGTPSIVPPECMEGVLNAMEAAFAIRADAEITAEANPGTLGEAWLKTLLAHGLNRLSLGVQAAQDGLLRRIGRIHTFAEAKSAVKTARRAGIANVSVDLMFGLPGQTLADYRETLQSVLALSPKHVSAYSLIVEEGTPLCREVRAGTLSVPDDDAAADFYELGLKCLEKNGFDQYEISNFAADGFRCRHNVGYWQGAWYLGLGVSAHSMLPPDAREIEAGALYVRKANANDREAYVRALSRGMPAPAQRQPVSKTEAMFETMMLGLRMNDGVSERAFGERFGVSLAEAYGDGLRAIQRDGLGRWTADGRFCLTPRGLLLQNDALLRLMP